MLKKNILALPLIVSLIVLAGCSGSSNLDTHVTPPANGGPSIPTPEVILPPPGTPTEISGNLLTQTLTKAASPYHVTGDLLVPYGNTLTVEPGTFIDFKGHYKLDIQGHLKAIGTEREPIVFTATEHENWGEAEGVNRGWNGIRFLPYKNQSNVGEEDWIEYCHISYASKLGNNDTNDLFETAYINSTGAAIFLSGRPGAMTNDVEVPVTFHLNNNYIHHNFARRSGGGFFTICLSYLFETNKDKVDGYYNGVYTNNIFEENRCNGISLENPGNSYSGGGFAEFHSYYKGVHTFKNGMFKNNVALNVTAGQQVGGVGAEVTMIDVVIIPEENWIDAGSALTNTPAGSGETDPGEVVDIPPIGKMWIAPNHPCYQWGEVPPAKVPWAKITHLALGYVLLKEGTDGYTVTQEDFKDSYVKFKEEARAFTDAAHRNGRYAFMMVGGEKSNPDLIWNKATDAANIKKFAANIVAEMKSMNLDGIEIDWEEEIEWDKVGNLAKELRTLWPECILTIDTFPYGEEAESIAFVADVIDAFLLMTFANTRQWGDWIVPVPTTPLYEPDNNGYCFDRTLKKWTDAGVSPDKICFGVGGYGAAWGDENGDGEGPIAPYANRDEIKTDKSFLPSGEYKAIYEDNFVTQAWVDEVIAEHDLIEGWDDIGRCSYWHVPSETDYFIAERWDVQNKITLVFYESNRSMKEKLSYVTAKGLKGFNFWTLSQLINASSEYPVLNALTM